MKNIFKWGTHVVGLIPGFTVMLTNIFILPSFSSKLLGGLVEVCSVFIIIILWANKEKYINEKIKTHNRRCILFIILFFISFFSYVGIYQSCNGNCNDGAVFFKPLWADAPLTKYLDGFNVKSLNGLCDKDGNGAFYTESVINDYSPFSLFFSKLITYISFLSMFSFLTLAFGSLWVRYEKLDT